MPSTDDACRLLLKVRTPSDTSRLMVQSGHDADLVDDREHKAMRTLQASKETLEKANALCAKFEVSENAHRSTA